ncbi:MAG: carbon storage regulator CsrA [Chloroflexi bacterium]|nr:carbon storage regulator CsrA [Chloroflexota bacterium]
MLVLTRRPGESLLIDKDVVLTILDVDGDRIKIGISAPKSVTILRHELCDQIKQENREAASGRQSAKQGLESLAKVKLAPSTSSATDRDLDPQAR